MKVSIEWRGRERTLSMTKREFNSILRELYRELGEHWHRRFRPKHFTHRGFREYGYTHRSRQYQIRKQKRLGHNLPLVFSGRSRELSKSKRVIARAANGRAHSRVTMPVRAFNFRPRGSQVDMVKEFTTVSVQEVGKMTKRLQDGTEREFKRARREHRAKLQ